MGFFSSISRVVFREYDRRIKRASLITEYGAAHHQGHEHSEGTDAGHDHDEDAAEISNIPRGTPVDQPQH